MLLLCTAIAFRSPLLKRLDQIFRQVTYYELCHRSLLRRRIRQLYRFDCPDASIDSSRLNGHRPTTRSGFMPSAHSIGWREPGCDERNITEKWRTFIVGSDTRDWDELAPLIDRVARNFVGHVQFDETVAGSRLCGIVVHFGRNTESMCKLRRMARIVADGESSIQ
jgi:hypothetical protein